MAVTLGSEVDRGAIDQYMRAAADGQYENTGKHVPADDLEAVKQAFEAIAQDMVADTGGAAG